MRFSERTVKEYTKIYDYFYGKFVRAMNKKGKRPFKVSPSRQVQVIDTILNELPFEQATAIKLMIKYDRNAILASKISSMSKDKIVKSYDTAVRHMYFPKNIEFAAPGYYPKPRSLDDRENPEFENEEFTRLRDSDFGNSKYVLSALQKKSNIYYREQLYKHLELGWYYLYTLPGCGDGARIKILMALDKWEGKDTRV